MAAAIISNYKACMFKYTPFQKAKTIICGNTTLCVNITFFFLFFFLLLSPLSFWARKQEDFLALYHKLNKNLIRTSPGRPSIEHKELHSSTGLLHHRRPCEDFTCTLSTPCCPAFSVTPEMHTLTTWRRLHGAAESTGHGGCFELNHIFRHRP